jgi:hypothetical protein
MSLSHEHVGPKILGKIQTYVLTRAELLFTLCYEIPCITEQTVLVQSVYVTGQLALACTLVSKLSFCIK